MHTSLVLQLPSCNNNNNKSITHRNKRRITSAPIKFQIGQFVYHRTKKKTFGFFSLSATQPNNNNTLTQPNANEICFTFHIHICVILQLHTHTRIDGEILEQQRASERARARYLQLLKRRAAAFEYNTMGALTWPLK